MEAVRGWVWIFSGITQLGKMYGLSPGTKKTVCNNEVSIMSGCQ